MFVYSNVRCLRVIDGDTIEVAILLTPDSLSIKKRIRLARIDAPERYHEGGDESKLFLADLIQNKKIDLQVSKRDSFGRWIGEVYSDGFNMSDLMMDKGYAEPYKKKH